MRSLAALRFIVNYQSQEIVSEEMEAKGYTQNKSLTHFLGDSRRSRLTSCLNSILSQTSFCSVPTKVGWVPIFMKVNTVPTYFLIAGRQGVFCSPNVVQQTF